MVLLGVCTTAPGISAQTFLVSYSGDHQVAFVDSTTNKILRVVPTAGKGPHEITVSPDGRLAYIAISGTGPDGEPGNSITVLDLKTMSRTASFDLGSYTSPHDTRVSRDGTILWVACAPSQTILELDAATGAVRKAWKTGVDGGWFLAVTPDDRKIYVPHLEGKSVTMIDRKSGSVRTIHSGGTQGGIDVSPDGREVWVLDADKRLISIFDTSTDALKDTVSLGADAAFRLRFAPDGKTIIVNHGRKLTIYNAATRTPLATIPLPAAAKVVTVAPDGLAFVSYPDANLVSIIHLGRREVVATLPVGKAPDGVAWFR